MLVINPDECIDCGVCEPECPPEAILPDTENSASDWLQFNLDRSLIWPNITERRDPLPEADNNFDKVNKFETQLIDKPALQK